MPLTPTMAATPIIGVCKGAESGYPSLISEAVEYHRAHGGQSHRMDDQEFCVRTLECLRADGTAEEYPGGD
jgi:hypothetical protein